MEAFVGSSHSGLRVVGRRNRVAVGWTDCKPLDSQFPDHFGPYWLTAALMDTLPCWSTTLGVGTSGDTRDRRGRAHRQP
jgi:hypothetical protein